MKAIIQEKFGSADVLELKEIDKPVIKDNQVLIRVHAAGVNAGDWHLMTGTPYLIRLMGYGLFKPKNRVPGQDVSGRVEEVGFNATKFQPGDEVFGDVGRGAYAEYVCASEDDIALKPANLTFEQAAAVPIAAITALHGLRDKGQIKPGQKVLINGASGGVGTFAVQIAKSFEAEVTGVCSTRNVNMVLSIGADHVIDYTREDFTQSGQTYDLILDVVGNRSVSDCRRVLSANGIYIAVSGPMGRWLGPMPRTFKVIFASLFGRQKLVPLMPWKDKEDLVVLQELLSTGTISPVVDRAVELSEVAEALRKQGEGHARGKYVITV